MACHSTSLRKPTAYGSGVTTAPEDERHPVARLGETIGRLPRYLALGRSLVRDPAVPRWRKVALGAGLVYLVSPIDLVPGVIPVAGQLDDLAAMLIGLRVALRGCTPEASATHLAAAGLAEGDIGRDLEIVRGTAGWVAGRVARATAKISGASIRTAAKAARLSATGAVRATRAAVKRARSG
jgi:uncharacterized membrane protein YkvA (DUF1232 family)